MHDIIPSSHHPPCARLAAPMDVESRLSWGGGGGVLCASTCVLESQSLTHIRNHIPSHPRTRYDPSPSREVVPSGIFPRRILRVILRRGPQGAGLVFFTDLDWAYSCSRVLGGFIPCGGGCAGTERGFLLYESRRIFSYRLQELQRGSSGQAVAVAVGRRMLSAQSLWLGT